MTTSENEPTILRLLAQCLYELRCLVVSCAVRNDKLCSLDEFSRVFPQINNWRIRKDLERICCGGNRRILSVFDGGNEENLDRLVKVAYMSTEVQIEGLPSTGVWLDQPATYNSSKGHPIMSHLFLDMSTDDSNVAISIETNCRILEGVADINDRHSRLGFSAYRSVTMLWGANCSIRILVLAPGGWFLYRMQHKLNQSSLHGAQRHRQWRHLPIISESARLCVFTLRETDGLTAN
jgi:hypothetical protein